MPDDARARAPLDVRIDSPGREGLAGTTPASVYAPIHEAEHVTVAPDGRPMDEQPAWRADFPIDWPQDHYVERRDFMKFMVLTSLAFTVGQFWIAGQNWWWRRRGRPAMRKIASIEEVPVGGVVTFEYPGGDDPCVLIRTGPAALVAYDQRCTHLSCAVLPRVEQGIIHCPCHEGFFDLQSGRPIAGPPRRPLPRIRLETHGSDIYAVGVEERTV